MRTILFATICCSLPLLAQAPAQTKGGGPDPGVSPKRIMERPQVRVGHVTLAPGATRSIHKHDEFAFQLFVPLTGDIELTIGGKLQKAAIGEAYFIDRSEPHGFKNTGSSEATALEIFVKDPNAKTAALALAGAAAQ